MRDALLARPASSPSPRGPARRRRTALVAAVAVLALLGAACSDDSDGGEEADRSTTTTTESTGSTDSTTTTVDNSQGRPLNESEELVAALAEPATFGDGLEVDPSSVGDGSFQLQLCPDTSLEATWDDQASQGLLRAGEAGTTLIVRQSVLAFPDAGVADAFIDDYLAAVTTCNPTVQVEDDLSIGERGARFTAATGEQADAAGAFVRAGTHVAYVDATGDPASDLAAVVNDERLTAVAALLPT